jgi:hypothetical protein
MSHGSLLLQEVKEKKVECDHLSQDWSCASLILQKEKREKTCELC